MNLKQSRLVSLAKSVVSTAVGFGLSLACQWLFFAVWLGLPLTLTHNLSFALIMTAVSIGRQFILERVFEFLRVSRKLSAAMVAVIAERFRQIEEEGWDAAHDDVHSAGELAIAGACYAMDGLRETIVDRPIDVSVLWPWEPQWWKPADRRRNLVKACALILAEIERFDRRRKRKPAASDLLPAGDHLGHVLGRRA